MSELDRVVQVPSELAEPPSVESRPAEVPDKDYFASILPGPETPISRPLGAAVQLLQDSLGAPLWVIIQDHEGLMGHLDDEVFQAVHARKEELARGEAIALLVHSPGGIARDAYQIARFLQRRCGAFTAVVPKAAMSAATLLALGADRLVMAPDAKLGPLDAQLWDPDSENFQSALDEVQALERLHANALESFDEFMFLMLRRTGKKVGSLLPEAIAYTTGMMRPLLEKIDVVHYNERSRILKVAEEYAKRLLTPRYGDKSEEIASRLVTAYPEHGFPIDVEEAREIGLHVDDPPAEQCSLLEGLWLLMDGQTVIGRVMEGPRK